MFFVVFIITKWIYPASYWAFEGLLSEKHFPALYGQAADRSTTRRIPRCSVCLHFGITTLAYFTRINFGVFSIFPTGTKASFLIAVLVLLLCKAILLYAVLLLMKEETFPTGEKCLCLASTPARIVSYIPLGMTRKLFLPLLLFFSPSWLADAYPNASWHWEGWLLIWMLKYALMSLHVLHRLQVLCASQQNHSHALCSMEMCVIFFLMFS